MHHRRIVLTLTLAVLAAALMSIGAVVGVTLGDAVNEIALDGKTFHDPALSRAPGVLVAAGTPRVP